MGERRYWRRILVVNAVGALAAFGLLGGLVSSAPWSVRGRGLVACIVYANCIGGVIAVVMRSSIVQRYAYGSRVKRWAVRFVAIAGAIVTGCAAAGLVLIAIRISPADQYWLYLSQSLWISFLVGTVATFAVSAYETLRGELDATALALKTKQFEEERARTLAIEAQLASLESRVHPHFLFNTLNSIASLVHDDPAAAERVVGQLASLLRSSLDGGAVPLVRLDEELAVVRDYLEIERVRFGDRLRYTIEAPPEASPVLVPRLALQTIVENSVKYAVAPRRGGAAIAVRGALADGHLRLDVVDDGAGFDASDVPAAGHGLALVQARLAMIFGDRAALAFESAPGHTCVSMTVPRDSAPV
jgi:two-component system sensor histidine kinase AlgZ